MAYPQVDTESFLIESLGGFQDRLEETGCCQDAERDYHVTALYGLIDNTPNAIKLRLAEATKNFKITLEIADVSLFNNDEFDVIKLDFKQNAGLKKLTELNTIIREFPNDCKFPTYNAHLTIAYVDPGRGADFITEDIKTSLIGRKLVFDRLLHSSFKDIAGNRQYTQVDSGKLENTLRPADAMPVPSEE